MHQSVQFVPLTLMLPPPPRPYVQQAFQAPQSFKARGVLAKDENNEYHGPLGPGTHRAVASTGVMVDVEVATEVMEVDGTEADAAGGCDGTNYPISMEEALILMEDHRRRCGTTSQTLAASIEYVKSVFERTDYPRSADPSARVQEACAFLERLGFPLAPGARHAEAVFLVDSLDATVLALEGPDLRLAEEMIQRWIVRSRRAAGLD